MVSYFMIRGQLMFFVILVLIFVMLICADSIELQLKRIANALEKNNRKKKE